MKKAIKVLRRSAYILTVAALLALGWLGNKLYILAADPTEEKDCGPDVQPAANTTFPTLDSTPAAPIDLAQKGGTINDVSCLNRTPIYGIVAIHSEDDILRALQHARARRLKVSIAAAKHSMGGQAFGRGALILDMRGFNRIAVNPGERTVTVQAGARWHDIQDLLHPKFAIKAMQSTDVFSVGGSISVNAHGMDHHAGSIMRTIRSMRVMLPDGQIQQTSPQENPELFRLVIGGYGLFGIILEATLDIEDNHIYQAGRRLIAYDKFPDWFEREFKDNPAYGLLYGHLSTAPSSLLREMVIYTYQKSDITPNQIPPLHEVSSIWLRRLTINLSKLGRVFKELKWLTEKHIEPKLESCTISRTSAMASGEACLLARNEPMHDSVSYLFNRVPKDTDILHEYFVPRPALTAYIDGLREVFKRNNTNLLNASVRVVHKEENFLSYAPEDAFAVVLYINQTTDSDGNEKMRKVTRELIDLTHRHRGRFFLPYQLHYTKDQLLRSYPETKAFFELKRKYDPDGLLSNTWFEKYASSI